MEENFNNENVFDMNNALPNSNDNNINISNQLLNDENKDENYGTDSDIDDPKYMPAGNILENNQFDFAPQNVDNQNKSEIFLKSKVMALQNDANLANQTMKELENENNLLRTEILKNKEKIQSKDGSNYIYEDMFSIFKQRFEQFEEINNNLQKKR